MLPLNNKYFAKFIPEPMKCLPLILTLFKMKYFSQDVDIVGGE